MLFHRVRCTLLSLASCSFLGQQIFVQTIPPAQAAIPPNQGQTSKTYPVVRPPKWFGNWKDHPTAEQACEDLGGSQRLLQVKLQPPIVTDAGLKIYTAATCVYENGNWMPTQVDCYYDDHPPYDYYIHVGGTKGICVLSSVLQKPGLTPHLPSLSEALASFPDLSEALTQVPLPELTQEGGYTKTDPSQPQPEIQVAVAVLAAPAVPIVSKVALEALVALGTAISAVIVLNNSPQIPSPPAEQAPPPQTPTDNGTDNQATKPDQPPSQSPTNNGANNDSTKPKNTPDFIPEQGYDKIPPEWGEGEPNRKKQGWRWQRPGSKGGDSIRIDKGNPDSQLDSQKVDHVRINSGGKVLDENGKSIDPTPENPNPSDTYEAHIPLSKWLQWRYWNQPQ